MLNREIISDTLPSLNPGDSVAQALDLMSDFHVADLPVVAENKLLGLINEDVLLNATDQQELISNMENSFSKIVVHANTHFLEAVQRVNEFNLTVVPVVEEDSEYLGAISVADLFRQLSGTVGANESGGIIVLEMDKVDFSFSEISKLVETNDAQITQLNTYSDNEIGSFFVTLKINKLEIADIVATFQRYEYRVKYYFGEELYQNELRNNYDHLMNYLNI
ncbi:MAG TPA: CBS domain-containing protein [Puia sp.]|nr:CBS domain-containing protein [Puia sp.]